MNIIKNIIICCFLFNIEFAISQESTVEDKEGNQAVFNVDQSNGSIAVKVNDKTYLYKDVVGTEGQMYKDFIIFNDQPALWYSNSSSKNNYDIYYTLLLKNEGVFIDCAYANITLSDYSIVLNRAVCGLNKELTNDYSNLIYSFSDSWENDISNKINNLNGLKVGDLPLGHIDNINVLIKFNIEKELDSDISEIVFALNNKKYKLTNQKIYLVSFAENSNQLVRVDKVLDKEEVKQFLQYDKNKLKEYLIHQ